MIEAGLASRRTNQRSSPASFRDFSHPTLILLGGLYQWEKTIDQRVCKSTG